MCGSPAGEQACTHTRTRARHPSVKTSASEPHDADTHLRKCDGKRHARVEPNGKRSPTRADKGSHTLHINDTRIRSKRHNTQKTHTTINIEGHVDVATVLLKKSLNELGRWGTGEYDAIVHSAGVVGADLLEVRATFVVGNKRLVINVLLDTGVTHTFIAKSFVEKHNIPTTRMERGLSVKVANGAIMQVTQMTRPIPLEFGDHVKRLTRFAVIENDRFDAIIGLNFMAHFRALIDAAARRIVFQNKRGTCFQLNVLQQEADTLTFCNGFIPRIAPESIA